MRQATQSVISSRFLGGMLAMLMTGAGCTGMVEPMVGGGTGSRPGIATGGTGPAGTGGVPGGGGNTGTGNTPGGTGGGHTGTGGMANTGGAGACTGASDPRLVVAPQRLVRLTLADVAASIRVLIDPAEATSIITTFQIGNEADRTFPPLNSAREGTAIIATLWEGLDGIANHVAKYVFDNFTRLSACPATPTDACAQTYINALAEKVYRRPLDAMERTRLTTLYTSLKASTVNGVALTSTIQEATQGVVYALFSTPQFLYRSELGNRAMLSTAPPGVPLTQWELASQLSYTLAGTPPDTALYDAARAGTLAANVGAQVTRLLLTQPVKDSLTTAMATYYKINLLPNVIIDPAKYPVFNVQLRTDMATEATKFISHALWSGNLTEMVTSKVAFLNSNAALASLYGMPVPAGATATNFVQTTLTGDAAARRSGIVTNVGFITSRARPDSGSVVPRGLVIKDAMLCVQTPGPGPELEAAVAAAKAMIPNQTAKQQIAYRESVPVCASCHANFDSYGLVLENYDAIGGWRTVDEMNRPVDTATKLPAALGGANVANAMEFAQTLANNPGFSACIAKSVMQYALSDVGSPVDVGGCAVADVNEKYNAGTAKTFSEMVRQVMTSKTIALREAK